MLVLLGFLFQSCKSFQVKVFAKLFVLEDICIVLQSDWVVSLLCIGIKRLHTLKVLIILEDFLLDLIESPNPGFEELLLYVEGSVILKVFHDRLLEI